jgi:DNA-binding Lrp family transcriptional regulator
MALGPWNGPLPPDIDSVTLSNVETTTLDLVDRQIIHVLAVEARASFRAIGEVVGVSDQTAARRYRRLRETAGLGVFGLVRGSLAGWVDWLVRLQITPGSANAIADALARRPDTRWVRLYSGGTEVVCVLQARSAEQRDALFLHGLPGSRRVVQVSAYATMHVFSPVNWSSIYNALSADQLAQLTPAPDPATHGPGNPAAAPATAGTGDVRLQPGDDPLLTELARDGRTSIAALAAATHWHESTVRRRIAELTGAGLLYFDVDIDDALFGHKVSALLLLSVEPARLDEVGRLMATHPEIPFVAAVTGQCNLVAQAVVRDTAHLYEYVSGRLAGLPGLRSVETMPAIGTVKRASSQR